MSNKDVIGVNCCSKKYMNHLGSLFETVNFEEYTWYVSCSENFASGEYTGRVELFLPDGVYSGEQLRSVIRQTPKYYIHLLRLFAVPLGKNIECQKINNYKDFLESEAEIALLSADSDIDLYVKNFDILQNVIRSCMNYYGNEVASPKLITLQNDDRTGFWV